jgi:hypothetical protein
MKKYLVLVPTGNNTQFDFTNKDKYTFDTCLIYYGEGEEDRFKKQATYYFKLKSPKYALIKSVLPQIPWQEYKFIWLCDDDMKIENSEIDRMMKIADDNHLTLSQPAIGIPGIDYKKCQEILNLLPNTKDQYNISTLFELRKKYSDKSHEINKILYYVSYPALLKKYDEPTIRSVEFIEVQCPLLSRDTLKKAYNLLTDPLVVTGFGIDEVWSQPGFIENKYVIDDVVTIHTNETHFRQYESFLKGKIKEDDVAPQYRGLKMNPKEEARLILEKYKIDKITISSEAFDIYIDEDQCLLTHDLGGWESRNKSMMSMITDTYNKLIKNNIKGSKIDLRVYTGDAYKSDINKQTVLKKHMTAWYQHFCSIRGQKQEFQTTLRK